MGLKTVHSVVQNFVYFYAFARLRSHAEALTGGKLGVAATLAVGTLAGWCNVLLTEPLDTVVTAKQVRCGAPALGKTQWALITDAPNRHTRNRRCHDRSLGVKAVQSRWLLPMLVMPQSLTRARRPM